MPHSAASDLGLHCLQKYHLWDARLICVNMNLIYEYQSEHENKSGNSVHKNKQENEHRENHDLSHLTKKKVHNHEYAFEYDTEIAFGLTSSLLEFQKIKQTTNE